MKQYDIINFADHKSETKTQKFINLYNKLKGQGALDDEKIFETALIQLKASSKSAPEALEDEVHEAPVDFGLVKSFTEVTHDESELPKDKTKTKDTNSGAIDIKSLF